MVTSAAYGFLGMVVILMMGFSGLQYRESGPSMAVHAQPCFHTENTDFRKGLELEAGCVSKGIGRLLGKGGKRKFSRFLAGKRDTRAGGPALPWGASSFHTLVCVSSGIA